MSVLKTKVAVYNCTASSEVNELQVSLLKELANSIEDWKFNEDTDVYSDVNCSKLTLSGRPAWSELLAKAKSGVYDMIVLKNVNSLVRNPKEYFEVTTELAELGVALNFLDNGFDTIEDEARCFGMFVLGANKSNDEVPHGKYIWGYRLKNDGVYIPDIDTLPLLVHIFMDVFTGRNIEQICFELEFSGCINPCGDEKWNKDILVSILKNRVYRDGDSERNIPPIIGDEVWDAVQLKIMDM